VTSVRRLSPQPVARLELALTGAEEMRAWAARLAQGLRPGDVIILTGELGAGKTTFTQGIGAGLGVRQGIISPTFVLSRIHQSLVGGPDLVPVDAYRLRSAVELADLDLDSTVDRSVTVVEWGRGSAEFLTGWPDDPNASWLDIELLRTTGGGITGAEGIRAELEAGTIMTDFSEAEESGHDELRTAVVLAYGPRWRDATLPRGT